MNGFRKYAFYNKMGEGGRGQQEEKPKVVQVGKTLLWLREFGFAEIEIISICLFSHFLINLVLIIYSFNIIY